MKPEKTWNDAMDSLYQIMLNEWSKEEIIEYIRCRDGYTKNDMTAIIPNEVYETIKRGLEDAVNGRVTEYAPIVRCKDCKFYWKNGGDCVADPNWFCGDGERKEKEDG